MVCCVARCVYERFSGVGLFSFVNNNKNNNEIDKAELCSDDVWVEVDSVFHLQHQSACDNNIDWNPGSSGSDGEINALWWCCWVECCWVEW